MAFETVSRNSRNWLPKLRKPRMISISRRDWEGCRHCLFALFTSLFTEGRTRARGSIRNELVNKVNREKVKGLGPRANPPD